MQPEFWVTQESPVQLDVGWLCSFVACKHIASTTQLLDVDPVMILWMEEILHRLKPWETIVCWYLLDERHSRVS